MKVGIRTGSLGIDAPEAALETAARLGYDGVELITRDEQQVRGWLEDGGATGAAALRAAQERTNCRVSSFSFALFRRVNFAQEDEALRQEGVALVSDAIRAVRNVGGEGILLPHFVRQTLDIPPEEEARMIDGLRQIAPVAEQNGVLVGLESSFSAGQLERITRGVGSKHVGVYQDLANAIIYQQDPEATIHTLGPAVVMVHVKDTDGSGQALLGEGKVDWAGCRRALREVGYDGWYVLETPAGPDPIANATRHLEFTRRWIAS
jgi:sugar phosphate isomerase/epimerase